MRPASARCVSGSRYGFPGLELYLWVGGESPLGQWVTYQWEYPDGSSPCLGSTPGGDLECGERHAVMMMRETRTESVPLR